MDLNMHLMIQKHDALPTKREWMGLFLQHEEFNML